MTKIPLDDRHQSDCQSKANLKGFRNNHQTPAKQAAMNDRKEATKKDQKEKARKKPLKARQQTGQSTKRLKEKPKYSENR